MSNSLRGRVGHLTVGMTTKNQLAKTAFVEWVTVCCSAEEWAEYEPSDCGGPGFIAIRAASWDRYRAKVTELRAEGWILLEG